MFADFEAKDGKVAISIKAENSWDMRDHNIWFADQSQTILGIPRGEFCVIGHGRLSIVIIPQFQGSVHDLDIDNELKTGANIRASFFDPTNPEHINRFTLVEPPWVCTRSPDEAAPSSSRARWPSLVSRLRWLGWRRA